jgi:hypothetical protein
VHAKDEIGQWHIDDEDGPVGGHLGEVREGVVDPGALRGMERRCGVGPIVEIEAAVLEVGREDDCREKRQSNRGEDKLAGGEGAA